MKRVLSAALALVSCVAIVLAAEPAAKSPVKPAAKPAAAPRKPVPPPPPPPPLTYKAGVAATKITPAGNMWLSGYAARKKPSEGVAQDLFAKALAIEDEAGNRFVIVTHDIIGIRRELRDAVAQRVQEQYNLPPAYLLLNASHTHCGPEYRGSRPEGAAYRKELEDKVVTVIGEAIKKLQPARLSFAHARAGFAMNRRKNYALPENDPNAKIAPTYDGPVDHEVPVLRVENAEGKLIAIMVGYACHNTTLSSTSLDPKNPVYEINGDYAGFAQEALQQRYPEAVAMFLMGCGADQNPYPRHNQLEGVKPLDLAKFHGQTLAYAAEAAMLTGPRNFNGVIRAAMGDVELTRNSGKPSHAYPVQVVKFGEYLTLIAFGSETCVEYALRMKRELHREPWKGAVWVAGYSNDYAGYIPSQRVAKEGGYEAANDFTLDVEERIVGKAHELLRSLK